MTRHSVLLWLYASLIAGISSTMAQPTQWKPSRPVELIVGVSPGGGIDRTARTVQKIMQDKRLIDVAVSVINKPGGGSTIAQAYLNQHAGDAHYYEISATSLLTNHITGKSALSHKDFTPIAMLSDEYIGFAVKADSPLRSGKDLLDILKTRPESLPIGIATAAGNTNHIAAGIVAKSAGGDVKKLRVVVFGSGGEAMTALLGGHVGLVATPSANLIPHAQSGRMRVLAVASPQRLVGPLAAVPTWREQGVNAIVANWRPVIGPKGLSAAQTAFWEDVLASVTRTEEWKQEVDSSGAVNHYMNSRELANYLDAQYAEFKNILSELGLAR
jgi:putative tricarboxylic transport membrane protein